MQNDTPRRIGDDSSHELFEIGLEVKGYGWYDRHVQHVVADISHDGKITLTRTDNGYTGGDENGTGYKPYVETQRFELSVSEMKLLIEAWQTVQAEEQARDTKHDRDEVPF